MPAAPAVTHRVAFSRVTPPRARTGISAPSKEDLIGWCRQHLAGFKTPRHIVFAEIPKTSTGKIQKFKLRETAKAV